MADNSRIFTVDKFLGINEAPDGSTELRMGEASKMENFFLTDGYNLKVRPGIIRLDDEYSDILASWSGWLDDKEYMVLVDIHDGVDRIRVYTTNADGTREHLITHIRKLGMTQPETIKIFPFSGKLWVMCNSGTVTLHETSGDIEDSYIPLLFTAGSPLGGGAAFENANLLNSKRRVEYTADGETKEYQLPEEALSVLRIVLDNETLDVTTAGTWDDETHKFTFTTAPAKGVSNLEFMYDTDHAATAEFRRMLCDLPLVESYNGSTDTRLFFGGGSNILYYSGINQLGAADATYFPAGNEINIDMSGAEVTAINRHYGKLMVWTKDSAYSVTYEPVTLEGGDVIAGFYLRPVSKEFGHDYVSKIQTVNNSPRTISNGAIYEWRMPASAYRDERYAVRISNAVQRTLSRQDIGQIITVDDDREKTFYAFLNDAEGTILVNRYALADMGGLWCIYKASIAKHVRNAFCNAGQVVFLTDAGVFAFNGNSKYDYALLGRTASTPIHAVWESGYQHFGTDFRRKFSSLIYISMLPQSHSHLVITAKTDKRSEYSEKEIEQNVFSFQNTAFDRWTFDTNDTPRIQRIKLKVKKFVYYKLIFEVNEPGAEATILGYDQQVRFSSMAK